MSFEDFAKLHINQIVNGLGSEAIEYKRSPGTGFLEIQALVDRAPTDQLGARLPRIVHVTVSKTDIAGDRETEDVITVDGDELRLDGVDVYRVMHIVEEWLGHYTLEAVK